MKRWTLFPSLFLAGMFGVVGCQSLESVKSADLEALTNDLAAINSGLGRLNTSSLSDADKHALQDVQAAIGKGVTVGDLLTRVARGAGH